MNPVKRLFGERYFEFGILLFGSSVTRKELHDCRSFFLWYEAIRRINLPKHPRLDRMPTITSPSHDNPERMRGSRDGAVGRALASHQCGPGLSLLLVLAPSPRVFLRVLRFSLLY